MFEQTFKNIDNALWKDAGASSELDYTEQTSWILFLKYLDDLEQDRAMHTELVGKSYGFIIDKPYQWETWAIPKKPDGAIDHNKAKTGDDLRGFIDHELFPSLRDRSRVVPRSDKAGRFHEAFFLRSENAKHSDIASSHCVTNVLYPLLGIKRGKQDGWDSRRHWRSVALSFCRLLGLGCPKQAFAKIATPFT
ncbi:type I restriction-modification system subunit M N-terminal domain-containing protein [Methyloglobulus sp.]|uniref:type I restriction-modification system subunit M N-terminal domain-containing protein n=1 Tax=Methyloglobulus sp. TaxID=2518622 RepID=UPI00398A33EA